MGREMLQMLEKMWLFPQPSNGIMGLRGFMAPGRGAWMSLPPASLSQGVTKPIYALPWPEDEGEEHKRSDPPCPPCCVAGVCCCPAP